MNPLCHLETATCAAHSTARRDDLEVQVGGGEQVAWFDQQLADHHHLGAGRSVGDYLRQVVRLRGRPETRYFSANAEPAEHTPTQWQALVRGHRGAVEIRHHWRRDAIWGEDGSRTRNATALANLAQRRNARLALLPEQSADSSWPEIKERLHSAPVACLRGARSKRTPKHRTPRARGTDSAPTRDAAWGLVGAKRLAARGTLPPTCAGGEVDGPVPVPAACARRFSGCRHQHPHPAPVPPPPATDWS